MYLKYLKFALTSQTECFPMVLLESLKNGLPVVSYDCPYGPRNIITANQDGILVKHNNIEAFAKQLSNLIDNKNLKNKMSKRCVENFKRFEEKVVMDKWFLLFNKMINRYRVNV